MIAPWQQPEWLVEVQTWLETQLPSISKLETVHSGSSAFWGVAWLEGQKLHFKAVPNSLTREMRLTPFLPSFSSAIPKVLACEPNRGWLLTKSAGETHLIHDPTLEHWLLALRSMAELQMATLQQHPKLLEAGCVVLKPKDAQHQVRVILESSADQHASSALEVVQKIQLEGLELLPLSLIHGDFHPMNVIAPNTIIDWSDALVSHPFVDLERFLRWIMGNSQAHHWSPFEHTRELEPRFIRAFLEPWADFVPIATLETVFRATRPFGLAVLLVNAHANTFEGRSLEAFYIRQLAKTMH